MKVKPSGGLKKLREETWEASISSEWWLEKLKLWRREVDVLTTKASIKTSRLVGLDLQRTEDVLTCFFYMYTYPYIFNTWKDFDYYIAKLDDNLKITIF